ncbi:MAG: hypothetical protein D6753_04025 [Planctomycetota bacterium]|nr:MAG: hypothetical protein D6753_04025 [Planctomycetota bacterium]
MPNDCHPGPDLISGVADANDSVKLVLVASARPHLAIANGQHPVLGQVCVPGSRRKLAACDRGMATHG